MSYLEIRAVFVYSSSSPRRTPENFDVNNYVIIMAHVT